MKYFSIPLPGGGDLDVRFVSHSIEWRNIDIEYPTVVTDIYYAWNLIGESEAATVRQCACSRFPRFMTVDDVREEADAFLTRRFCQIGRVGL